MKKNVWIALCMLAGLFLTACNSNEPQFHKAVVYMEVAKNEWKFDKDLKQFYVRFNVPELTAGVFNYGNYSLHREYNTGTADVYQVALPQSLYLWEEVTNADSTTTIVYYQQLVDYRIGPGYVEIQVTNSDYFYGDYTPDAMLFHLQLTY